eukprot:65530-Rhodomonas_salina.1
MPEAFVFEPPGQYVLKGDVASQSLQVLEMFLVMKYSLSSWLDGCMALVTDIEGKLLASQISKQGRDHDGVE